MIRGLIEGVKKLFCVAVPDDDAPPSSPAREPLLQVGDQLPPCGTKHVIWKIQRPFSPDPHFAVIENDIVIWAGNGLEFNELVQAGAKELGKAKMVTEG